MDDIDYEKHARELHAVLDKVLAVLSNDPDKHQDVRHEARAVMDSYELALIEHGKPL